MNGTYSLSTTSLAPLTISPMSDKVNGLIERIQKLDLNQRRIINELIDELADEPQNRSNRAVRGTAVAANVGIRTQPRVPNHNYISANGVPLSIGDRVEIKTSRKVGRSGDIAEVSKFNKKYVAITVLSSGRSTQRDSKYLDFIE